MERRVRMRIDTEVYPGLDGTMKRRHIVDLGGSSAYSLKTKELFTLAVLCFVELGKCLSNEPTREDNHAG